MTARVGVVTFPGSLDDRDAARAIQMAGAAPIPWVLDSPEALDEATPLPGTAYKVEIARALVRRALEAVA